MIATIPRSRRMVVKPILDYVVAGILPAFSSRRIAKILGINQRTIQRLAAGPAFAPGAEHDAYLQSQRKAVAESGLIVRLQELMVAADRAGVHPEIVAAWLDDTHVKVVGKPIE